jgi:hypothetical protein
MPSKTARSASTFLHRAAAPTNSSLLADDHHPHQHRQIASTIGCSIEYLRRNSSFEKTVAILSAALGSYNGRFVVEMRPNSTGFIELRSEWQYIVAINLQHAMTFFPVKGRCEPPLNLLDQSIVDRGWVCWCHFTMICMRLFGFRHESILALYQCFSDWKLEVGESWRFFFRH